MSHQQEIFDIFTASVADGWEEGIIAYRIAGKRAAFEVSARMSDGSTSHPSIAALKLGKAIRALRSDMANPGSGAWFSALIRLNPNGQFSMDVDYDSEPAWNIPVVAATYLEEQQLFPRDEEHQPEWYRQKLREAQSG